MARIVTCTVNPAIDIWTVTERIEPYRKLRCAEARRDPGGGGINVARVLARFGVHATAIYPTGGATGELLRQLVARDGIESVAIPIGGETREDFTVTEGESKREYRFVLAGPPLSADACRALTNALETAAPPPEFAILSGSVPQGVAPGFYAGLIRAVKARGARVVVDTSGPALKEALAEGVHLVKPNLRELSELMGERLETEAQRLQAARTLTRKGSTGIVALSLAEKGALLVTRDRAWRARTPSVTPVSTVGAGDSFLGALVFAVTSGRAPDEALRYGVAAGTAALLWPGTELCHRVDVERLLPEVAV